MSNFNIIFQGGPHDGKAGQYIGHDTDVLYSTGGQVAYFSDDPDSAFTPGDQHLVYRKTGEVDEGRQVYAFDRDIADA